MPRLERTRYCSPGDPPLFVVAERLKLAGSLGRRGLRRAMRVLAEPLRPLARLRAKAPQRLLIAPQDIRTVDPTIAAEIEAGYFAFGGKIVNAGGLSPFQIEAPSQSWARALGGFGWLKHLRAADTAVARGNARMLVEDFLKLRGRPAADDPMWEPRVVSRRILAFLSQSPMILEGAEPDFYRRFMHHFARAKAHLTRALAEDAHGEWRLFATIALAELAVCSDADQRSQRPTQLLARELSRQLMADGGHIGRNPQTLVDLLLELLPLRQAYAARGTQMPPALLNAIDRMIPILRLLRHGDGSLALFNGMSVTQPELIATLLTYDDVRGRALLNAPYSGYQRMEARDCVLVADTGRAPPRAYSGDAHAGCLSFEFSCRADRIIVNCGAPGPNRDAAREIARTSAAHSTLIVEDTSSCRFSSSAGLDRFFRGQILSGPTRVEVARSTTGESERLALSHDGYASRFGLIHARNLTLSRDGMRLLGEDSLARSKERGTASALRYALRFHLHPAVAAALIWEGQGIVLDLPGGERFTFDAGGREVLLEDSIFFAAPNGPRNSRQIVIDGRIEGDVTITWTLARVAD